jgi:predicted MFS family arabinose efflux permease
LRWRRLALRSSGIVLLGAMVAVGLMAVVVQVLVAYTAALATPSQRGQAVGSVTSGIVLGILLARLTSGLIADFAGWRAVYFASSALMLIIAAVLWKLAPVTSAQRDGKSYLALIRSLFALLAGERILRIRGLLALLIFADFSVLWTAMVLPLSARRCRCRTRPSACSVWQASPARLPPDAPDAGPIRGWGNG